MSDMSQSPGDQLLGGMENLNISPEDVQKILNQNQAPEHYTVEDVHRGILFHIARFGGRVLRRTAQFAKASWPWVKIAGTWAVALGFLAAVAIGAYLFTQFLFGINALLAWGFVVALTVQALFSTIAFTTKTAQRLNSTQLAVLL